MTKAVKDQALPDPRSYVAILDIPERTVGDYAIKHTVVPAGKVMSDTSERARIFGGQQGQRFRFDEPTRWHSLTYEGGVWMTDLPIEQRQMREACAPLHGHVLVGGLGLGVAVRALLQNPAVKSVTVVEKSPEVIELVKPSLLETPALVVVKGDLFKYLKRCARVKKTFDSALFDIWQADGERILHDMVVPLLALAHGVVKDRPVCWNEDVMRGQAQASLETRAHHYMLNTKADALMLDQLAEPVGNIWHDWACGYWQAVRGLGHGLDLQILNRLAAVHAQRYGDPWAQEKT